MGRTSKNIKFRIPEKPRKIKGFRNGGFPIATMISSQDRYDHFDTAPRIYLKIRPRKKERTDGENWTKYSIIKAQKAQRIQGFFERRVPRSPNVFESAPL